MALLFARGEQPAQREALEELRADQRVFSVMAHVEDAGQVGVIDRLRATDDLDEGPARGDVGEHLRPDHLERNLGVDPHVQRTIDGADGPGAERFTDPVASRQHVTGLEGRAQRLRSRVAEAAGAARGLGEFGRDL